MEDVDTAKMPKGIAARGEIGGEVFFIGILDKVKAADYNRCEVLKFILRLQAHCI